MIELACKRCQGSDDVESGTFSKKRAKNSGSCERLILLSGEFYPGCWGAVMMQPAKGFSIQSA